jgi:hypothetical protein
MQNRALYEENARLNDLARMLLGSPHFSSFLSDMPEAVAPQVQAQQAQASRPQQPQQAPVPKEAAAPRPQEFQMQQNPQANIMMVPQQGMDASMAMNNGGWNSGIDMNFGNASVFAVLEVPQGPTLDAEVLSGKSSSPIDLSEGSPKNEAPALDRPEQSTEKSDIGVANPDIEIDESDPAFALFLDSPPVAISSDVPAFDGVQSEKASQFELVVDSTEVSASAKSRFNSLCQNMEAAFQRVSSVTSHLQ